jgi:hypothetical protein
MTSAPSSCAGAGECRAWVSTRAARRCGPELVHDGVFGELPRTASARRWSVSPRARMAGFGPGRWQTLPVDAAYFAVEGLFIGSMKRGKRSRRRIMERRPASARFVEQAVVADESGSARLPTWVRRLWRAVGARRWQAVPSRPNWVVAVRHMVRKRPGESVAYALACAIKLILFCLIQGGSSDTRSYGTPFLHPLPSQLPRPPRPTPASMVLMITLLSCSGPSPTSQRRAWRPTSLTCQLTDFQSTAV